MEKNDTLLTDNILCILKIDGGSSYVIIIKIKLINRLYLILQFQIVNKTGVDCHLLIYLKNLQFIEKLPVHDVPCPPFHSTCHLKFVDLDHRKMVNICVILIRVHSNPN